MDFWISTGFVDFSLDLWISHWICGFYIGFVDFTLDLWILYIGFRGFP